MGAHLSVAVSFVTYIMIALKIIVQVFTIIKLYSAYFPDYQMVPYSYNNFDDQSKTNERAHGT